MITFALQNKEEKAFLKFQKEHIKCKYQDAIGGKFAVTFILTGVGGVIVVKCQSCNKEENITDFDAW